MKKDNILLKVWRCFYVPGLYFAIMLTVQFIAMFVYMLVAMVEDPGLDQYALTKLTEEWLIEQSVTLTIVSGVIALPILWILMKSDKRRLKRVDELKAYEKVAPFKWLYIVVIGAAACIGFNLLITITGIINWGGGFEDTSEAIYGGNPVAMVLGVVFLIPMIEEFVFRGLVYERIRQYGGVKLAIFLSAVYFGVFHMNVPQGIYAFLIGVIIAWVYYKYKSVWAPVLFHVSANGFSVLLTFSPAFAEIEGVGVIVMCAVALVITALMAWLIYKQVNPKCVSGQYDTIVVGSGFAGAVVARELAEYKNEK
ncbi:MAG: CPBP family intramembrane metalloprotease, partial [Lachnospiraceae bacterium]|nr:CPBP family intramembrane metalloprotease [Lachnospiraceae bacterium]